MASLQDQYDQAMLDFSMADYDSAIAQFRRILELDPACFDAQLSLGMACFRKGDLAAAIAEGLKAERLRPHDPLVHTNLSLFYLKSGDKQKAEHHGTQARVAGWKEALRSPSGAADPELEIAKPPPPVKFSGKIPDMPWKKKKNPAPSS